MRKKITKSKILIIFLVAVLLFVPSTINQPKQTDDRALVIAVGVDFEDEQYLLSLQILEPESSQTFKETLKVYSSTGKNMLECMQNVSVHLGRISGFGNTSAIVFGNDVAKQGITESLDFFLRSKRLNDNATILTTNQRAKDLLSAVAKIDKNFAYSLNNLVELNKKTIISSSSTMIKFLNNYYGGTSASFVSQIIMDSDDNTGIDTENSQQDSDGAVATQAQTSSDQNAQTNNVNSVISNDGHTSVFVDGKQVAILLPEQMVGFNNLKGQKHGVYTLENVNDEVLQNAQVVMSIKNKLSNPIYEFKNGVPRIYYNLTYYLKVEQILQDGNSPLVLDSSRTYVSEEVKNLFISQIKTQIADSINVAKELNADLFDAQSHFNKFKHKEWQEYIKKLPNKEDAFQNIEFFVHINVLGQI